MAKIYLWFGLLLLARPVLAQEQFPIVPYSGMQVEYQLAGLEIDQSVDQEGSSRIRQWKGKVTEEVIKVFGTFFSERPAQDRFLLEISIDGQSKSLRLPFQDHEGPAKSPQAFELEMPIAPEAKHIAILLSATTDSIIGPREIKLQGTFKVQHNKQPDSSVSDQVPSHAVVGRIERISGTLEANFAAWQEWRVIKTDSDITPGILRTSDEDSAVLALVHGEKIFIDRNSAISLTEFGARLNHGTLRFQGTGSDGVYVAETPDYFIEFHGEHLTLEYMEEETSCSVLDGYAILSRKDDIEQAITIRSGVRAQGDPRGIRLVEKIDPKRERDLWSQTGLDNLPVNDENNPVPEATPQPDQPTPVPSPPTSQDQTLKPRIDIVLPDDPSITVIALDTTGGYTPDRKTEKPELQIFADGRVIINDLYGDRPQQTQQLSKENLIRFLDFAVNEHHFYELDAESMLQAETAYKAKQGGVELTDIPTTIIRLGIFNQTYEVRCRGADFLAAEVPEAKAVQDFNAIETRLRKYIDSVKE